MSDPVDLANASVFFDFDGTITPVDTGVYVLERLAKDGWREIDEAYCAGAIGSRECLSREWALVDADAETALAVAREVPIDPAFPALVAALHAAGADVSVVSDGFGFYAERVCADLGIACLTNRIDERGDITFPHVDRCCACSTCGTCKQAPIKDAKRAGRTTVFVGDGVSDRKAALLADVLFAKDPLASWCDEMGVRHTRFSVLADVHDVLVGSG